ncbi:MAG: murein biosynthesis integral membrane protein MurJ [Coraliomargaritaceae bacterium]
MLRNFKNIAAVCLSTGASRILGLLRDIIIYAGLGAGLWSSAFLLAFTLPNLFRRLLGEGALTSALVPVFGQVLHRNGRGAAFHFFSAVTLRLLLLLSILTTFGMLLLGAIRLSGVLDFRWSLAAELSVLLLPYMLFICLSAVFAAGLHVLGRFTAAASTPIVLNLAMILAMGGAMLLRRPPEEIIYWLCGGVLFGGILQLFIPAVDFARQGWRPKLARAEGAPMRELRSLLVPALAGAAILQVNIMISRLLAHGLNESAVSVLYLASRLMELPLGLFTISVTTVFFPLMADHLARKDEAAFVESFSSGLRLILGISLPAGIGLFLLGEPLVELMRFGRFEGADAKTVAGLVSIYGCGLPFYSVATFGTRGLHASKAIYCTVQIAGLCLLINLAGSLLFMQFWAERGLALANVVAALIQAVLLWRALGRRHDALHLKNLAEAGRKIIIASCIMAVFCLTGLLLLDACNLTGKAHAWIAIVTLIPGSIAVYFYLLYHQGFEELNLLAEKYSKKLRSRAEQ